MDIQNTQGQLALALEKESKRVLLLGHERALARVQERDDVDIVELLSDGVIRSVGHDGTVTYRGAGWRPRG